MRQPSDRRPAQPVAAAAAPAPTPTAALPESALGASRPQTDTGTAGPTSRTRVILGVGAAALMVAAVVGLAAVNGRSMPPAAGSVTAVPAPTGTTYASAPAAAVQRIHAALHDMGARCTSRPDPAAHQQIGRDVDQLINFTKTHPDARFTLDGEDGRSLDLLLIARNEMSTCAPEAADRANQALPAQYRTTTSPSPSAATGASTGK